MYTNPGSLISSTVACVAEILLSAFGQRGLHLRAVGLRTARVLSTVVNIPFLSSIVGLGAPPAISIFYPNPGKGFLHFPVF